MIRETSLRERHSLVSCWGERWAQVMHCQGTPQGPLTTLPPSASCSRRVTGLQMQISRSLARWQAPSPLKIQYGKQACHPPCLDFKVSTSYSVHLVQLLIFVRVVQGFSWKGWIGKCFGFLFMSSKKGGPKCGWFCLECVALQGVWLNIGHALRWTESRELGWQQTILGKKIDVFRLWNLE